MRDFNNFDDIERLILTVEVCKQRYDGMQAGSMLDFAGEQDRRDMATALAAMMLGERVTELVKTHIEVAHGAQSIPSAAIHFGAASPFSVY